MSADLQFTGLFGVYDPDSTDDHGPIYLVFPGGFMADCSNDATPGLDERRLEWIARTLNAALTSSPPPCRPAREAVARIIADWFDGSDRNNLDCADQILALGDSHAVKE